MKKLSIFASVSAALVCAAVPASFNWSPANVTLFSLDTAEAKVGRPLTATSVAGVSRRVHRREYRRAAAGAAVGAAVIGSAAAEAYVGGPAPPPGPAVAAAAPYGGPGYGYGLWALSGHCHREPCHGKVVQDRTKRFPMVLDAIAATKPSVSTC